MCCNTLAYQHYNLKLLWVPGHTRVDGKEKDDELANAESEVNFFWV